MALIKNYFRFNSNLVGFWFLMDHKWKKLDCRHEWFEYSVT